jgi:beta-galactosidase/beta-glucuronidase
MSSKFSGMVHEGENLIEVTVFDLVPGPDGQGKDDLAIGVNPGWEAYGGIILEVWIEFRPDVFIGNLRLAYELNADFSRAVCKLTVDGNSLRPAAGEVAVSLHHGSTAVARLTQQVNLSAGGSMTELQFEVDNPLLWATAAPHLYTLTASLQAGGQDDTYTCRTGFRHFAIRGRQFIWNGQPLILNGVCRHDMWLDQGFTLTKEQMRADMTAIKRMGANFVRLVHYPHHRYIIDLAEELGLLVTEEPGFGRWSSRRCVARRSMPACEYWKAPSAGTGIHPRYSAGSWETNHASQWNTYAREGPCAIVWIQLRDRCRSLIPPA